MVLASVLAATTGLIPGPDWFGRVGSMLADARYPCAAGRCGCNSVLACWTTCRCHTLAQKVAWAQRNGVPVPDFVDLSGLGSGLGRAAPEPACPLCTSHDDESGVLAAEATIDDERRPGLPTLTPLGCRGVELLLAFAAVLGTPHAPATPVFGASLTSERAPTADLAAPSRGLDVETPPPRLG